MEKIKDWKELDGVKLDGGIEIRMSQYATVLWIDNPEFPNIPLSTKGLTSDKIIKILAVFGLEVEFAKEPTITQNDYNWLVATNLNYTYKIKKQFNECNISVENQTIPFTKELFETLEYDKEYTVNELMKMKVEVEK